MFTRSIPNVQRTPLLQKAGAGILDFINQAPQAVGKFGSENVLQPLFKNFVYNPENPKDQRLFPSGLYAKSSATSDVGREYGFNSPEYRKATEEQNFNIMLGLVGGKSGKGKNILKAESQKTFSKPLKSILSKLETKSQTVIPKKPTTPTGGDVKPDLLQEARKGMPGEVSADGLFIRNSNGKWKPKVEAGISIDKSIPRTEGPLQKTIDNTIRTEPAVTTNIEIPSQGSSLQDSISDPVQKIIKAIKDAKPIRRAQEKLYTAERSVRFAKAQQAGAQVGGEKGFYKELSQLKGELPKAEFESLRGSLNQTDINTLFQKVTDEPFLTYPEKLSARTGLAKLLGVKGSGVPTKGELSLLEEIYGKEFTDTILSKRPVFEKLQDLTGDVLSVSRSLMAGGADMSYGLRQGVFGGYKYHKQWFSAFKGQFKWFFSQEALDKRLMKIKTDPDYSRMKENGLALTDLKSNREEQFFSNLAEKIPIIGAFVRASGRAYTGFANVFRADIFKYMVKIGEKSGAIDDPAYLKSAAEHINNLTGRGGLGKLEPAGNIISTALFSPRLLASRLNLLNPIYYARLHPEVRKEAIKTLFAFLGGTSTILGLAHLAGATDEQTWDSNSSDFLKIKMGITRIDIMGGFQQPIVLASRIISGKMTSSVTGKEMNIGEGYKPTTRLDIVGRFFESKQAPVASFLASMLRGTDTLGQPLNVQKEIINRVTPMFLQDMYDLYKEGQIELFPLAAPAAFFGAGVQTYRYTPSSKKEIKISEGLKKRGWTDKQISEYLLNKKKIVIQKEEKKIQREEKINKSLQPSTGKFTRPFPVIQ